MLLREDQVSGSTVKSLVLLLLAGWLLGVSAGCSGTPRVVTGISEVEGQQVPSWVLDPPSDPGVAFYAAASGRAKGHRSLALTDAEQSARVALARSLDTTVQAVFKRYMAEVVGDEQEGVDEALVEDVARSLTNVRLSGMVIEKTYPTESGEWWALARISFDDVATIIKRSAKKHLRAVRQNADEAFQELDRLLEEETER